MFGFRRGRVYILAVVAFLLGSVLLLSCQPAQPVPLGTPKPAEKAAAATPAKSGETPAAAATKPATQPAEKPVRGGTLRVIANDPSTLDPHVAPQREHLYAVYDQLVEPDVDGNPTKEGLLKDWTIGSDGKSITFKLREGVKFHDGTDFDAAAVKFNVDRVKDPATKSTYRSDYASVSSIDVVDSLTVRFNLSAPDPLLLLRMGSRGGLVVSPAAVKKYGVDFPRNPVGTGPSSSWSGHLATTPR